MNVLTRRVEMDGMEFMVIEWSVNDDRALTAAERDVARLVARGATNAEIARARGTSARTVANQVQSIMRKLEVASRVGLAAAISGRR
ncbi:MAG: helix-turn-helix transcriptional regulator [Labilithrix sp.]|nr:helix-turn-helix transcriptional regulator [Labilithrix sp.]MCW5815075.1 helix-turn-helix transcriptional regulator [Labilithrix sp.]